MYKYRGPFGNFMLISFQVYVKDIYNFIYSIYYNAKKKKKKKYTYFTHNSSSGVKQGKNVDYSKHLELVYVCK